MVRGSSSRLEGLTAYREMLGKLRGAIRAVEQRIGSGREVLAVGEEAYSLAAELLVSRSGRRRYLLRGVGQSMTGARIEDGDLLVVEEDEDPPEGAVVVALLRNGEEVTVKRLYREDGMVRLEPANGEHRALTVPAEEVSVQGRVLWVFHPPRG